MTNLPILDLDDHEQLEQACLALQQAALQPETGDMDQAMARVKWCKEVIQWQHQHDTKTTGNYCLGQG